MKNPIQSIKQVHSTFRTAPRLITALKQMAKKAPEEADVLWFILREAADAEFFCKVTDVEDQPSAEVLAHPQKYIAITGDSATAVVLFLESSEDSLIQRLANECKGCQDEYWAKLGL